MNDHYIRLNEARKIAGNISRTTLKRWEQADLFPKARQIGPNSVGYLASEIQEWVESREVS